LEDGALVVLDQAVTPALETAVRGRVELAGASLDAGQVAMLNLAGSIDGMVEAATIRGTLGLAPDAPSAKLAINAEGVRAGELAGYLAPGLVAAVQDGQFTMTLDAAAANHEAGGIAAHLLVNDLLWADRAADVTWARVGAFAVRAERLDPAA